jgi:predicted DNA-binding protein (MmcQ/YjbR family)
MNIEQLRAFCLSLPAVTEDIKWGHDLCFSVGGKMFCVTGLTPPSGASFKVSDEEFEELTAREGIVPAPYMARHKWVYAESPEALSASEWERYVRRSYELVKSRLPASTRKSLDLL